MVSPTRPRPSKKKKKKMMYDDWYTHVSVTELQKRAESIRKSITSEKMREANKKLIVSKKEPKTCMYGIEASTLYTPYVILKTPKNQQLKDYQDPASDNYDPLRVIKERMTLEEPNVSQTN